MADSLLQALNALYHHPDPQVKEQADKWLERWRQSTEAWQISDAVLHNPNADKQAQLFCAQTLKTKVQQDFEELPAASHSSLRDSLVTLLLKYGVGNPPVRTQLCLSLAAFTAHAPADLWGGTGAVQWFANRLGTEQKEIAVACMLELLAVLPEESESKRLCVGPARRDDFRRELKAVFPDVLQILTSCIGNLSAHAQVLQAFGSWLKLSIHDERLKSMNLHQHPVVLAALQALKGTDNFTVAVDVVVELLWLTVSHSRPDPQMMPLVNVLVPAVMQLPPRFSLGLQRAQAAEKGEDPERISPGQFVDDDEDTLKGLARLFCELGEAYVSLIAEGKSDVQSLVQVILAVTSHLDESISSMAFDFWHRLAHQLSSSFEGDPVSNVPAGHAPVRRDLFLPVYEQLVGVLQEQVRFPDNFAELRSDEKSDIHHRRDSVRQALVDPALVLGAKRILELLLYSLHAHCSPGKGGMLDWQGLEAALFCIRAVSSACGSAREALQSKLFSALASLPDHPQVQHMSCLCIAAYTPWVERAMRTGNADSLRPVLQLLTKNMNGYETSNAACRGFVEICEQCGSFMVQYVDNLLELYKRVMQAADAHRRWAPESADGPKVTEEDAHLVLEGVCHATSRAVPEDKRAGPLSHIVDPLIGGLQQAMEMNSPNSGSGTDDVRKQRVSVIVDRITAVFRYYRFPNGMTGVAERVWRLLDVALERLPSDSHSIERICRCVRYGIKSSGPSCAPLLNSLAASLPRRFAATQHPAFLYVASELAKIFGSDPMKAEALRIMLTDLMTRACSVLRRLEDFDEHPDVADDTFLLATRVLQYCPGVLAGLAQMVELLLDTACTGVLVQHHDACCSILSFLSRLVEPPRGGDVVLADAQRAFALRAPMLMRLLVAGMVGTLPFSRLEDVALTLHSVLKETRPRGVQWLHEAVSMIPDTSAARGERERFLGVALQAQESDSSRELENAVFDLADVCRRSRVARVAAQQALLPKELHQAVY